MKPKHLACKEAVVVQEQTSMQHLSSRCSVPPLCCGEPVLLTGHRKDAKSEGNTE